MRAGFFIDMDGFRSASRTSASVNVGSATIGVWTLGIYMPAFGLGIDVFSTVNMRRCVDMLGFAGTAGSARAHVNMLGGNVNMRSRGMVHMRCARVHMRRA